MEGQQVSGPAAMTPPADQPAGTGGLFGGAAYGNSGRFVWNERRTDGTAEEFARPAGIKKQQGAAKDAQVLYTSRPDGTSFGMARAPGEQWAGSK